MPTAANATTTTNSRRREEPRSGTASLDERIAAARASLSPAEDRVATFLSQHREEAVFLSAADIAHRLEMSDATVIRAVQSLGYSGLPALKTELQEALRTRATPTLRLGRSIEDLGDDPAVVLEHVLATEVQLLHDARETLRATDFARALKLLAGAQRVVIQGLGPNAPLGEYFAARLRRMRRPAVAVGARGQALADALIDMRRGDVVIVLAYDQSSPEAELSLERARELKVPSILITDTLSLALAGQFTVALSARRAGGGMFHLSALTIVVLDALLFGLAGQDRAAALAAADELQELRARIDKRALGRVE
ncbi:MAG TPA: MurR/RpiR family transcriptional regulator [Candidatus Limnocylindria bacterium]|nr:MurR/RpiR family transcriptional regulator [Candidatus Limnocylindria bacterium]